MGYVAVEHLAVRPLFMIIPYDQVDELEVV